MPKSMSDAERKALRFLVDVERSRRSFWDYCNVLAPDFYLPDRGYLYRVCMQLQDFLYNDVGVLIVNAPPRQIPHGGEIRRMGHGERPDVQDHDGLV